MGLKIWYGAYEGTKDTWWLRWCDAQGNLLPTRGERLEQEMHRAERAHQRAERLAARLRELGIEED